ncbi:glucosamine-6-phosphate deaminase [Bacillus sp. H-16]|uniref:glucosamine-6-phosphate deaminase n=1 Tax=Alteribacter salitolerans TaxID=2912333 RepID=UPI0019654E75|nr:glucosamine-6-phosphate deaminase [Alteribacter salitolerans]
MRVIKVEDYTEMSRCAALHFIGKLSDEEVNVMGLATGGTPEGMYKELIKESKKRGFSFKYIHTVNLDEYVGLRADDPHSYHTYMRRHLFDHIDIPEKNVHLPDGAAGNPETECERYEQLIRDLKKVNIQLLGIGENGHIGFNEPGTSFNSRTHVIELTPSTREANARFFSGIDAVPTHAITIGIETIMEAEEIVLLASGKNKSKALYHLICSNKVTEDIPATVLKEHPNLTIIADKEALALIDC